MRILPLLLLFSLLAGPASAQEPPKGQAPAGFGDPQGYEREAYGYGPAGKPKFAGQAEDFQVIFITSAPFTALVSYGLTGLASLAFRNTFSVDGDYLIPFIAGTVAGSATIASISVLTNKYPPPEASVPPSERRAFSLPLVQAKF